MIGSIEHTLTLDLLRSGVQGRLAVREGDSLIHRITVTLTVGNKPYKPEDAVLCGIYGLRTDGETVFTEGEITPEGKLTFTPGYGFFACPGPVVCKLSLRGSDGGELYSPSFAIDADPSAGAGDSAPAEEYSALEELLLRVLEAKRICEEAAEELSRLRASTDTPQMNGTASPGESESLSRADHVHPSDTGKLDAIENIGYGFQVAKGDFVPMYDISENKTVKISMTQIAGYVRNNIGTVSYAEESGKAEEAVIASALLSPETEGFYAVLPKLTSNSTVATEEFVRQAIAEAMGEG